jgi:ATP-dependent DNA helicase RecQ
MNSESKWASFIKLMLDRRYVCAVKGELKFLSKIQEKKELRTFKAFWISQDSNDKSNIWPSLHLPLFIDSGVSIPPLEEQTTFFLAERNRKARSNQYRLWWQDNNKSIPLTNFIKIVEKNTCQ